MTTTSDADYSVSQPAVYSCRCGAAFRAVRWRLVDVVARPELAERIRRTGPFEGSCPSCGESAAGLAPWVAVEPRRQRALLVLWEHQRGQLIEALQEHLQLLRERPELVGGWLIQPQSKFLTSQEPLSEDEAEGAVRNVATPPPPPARSTARERKAGVDDRAAAQSADQAPAASSPSAPRPRDNADWTKPNKSNRGGSGIPQLIGTESRPAQMTTKANSLGVAVGEVDAADGVVRVRARLARGQGSRWQKASLEARPIHLRHHGYPLAGIRVVGSYIGQVGCIEGIVDIGDPGVSQLFRLLSQEFKVQLCIEENGQPVVEREVIGRDLERNAALCLESAQGSLRSGEYPPEAYHAARASLEQESLAHRLERGQPSLARGAYPHLVGARETLRALEHLDAVSQPENLSRVLEVEGLPMREYEAIRRRILRVALEQGLCAPRRFWRRVVASGMARDLEDYAAKLASNRAAALQRDDDLDDNERHVAWLAIQDLCERKEVTPPLELREALELPDPVVMVDDASRPVAVAGEIGGSNGRSEEIPALLEQLRDPEQRLHAATEVLSSGVSDQVLQVVIDALDQFETEELLALLPNLSELGSRLVPSLVPKLDSERREVRQVAVILLGMSASFDALDPLVQQLVQERTTVWLDVARALGVHGTPALDPLCALLEGAAEREDTAEILTRAARAMAEIAVENSDGEGRLMVERLAEDGMAADALVSTAARRALVALNDVSESGAQIRGERPFAEVTEVRGFSRRAYEAIMVPELELVEDVELEA